MKRINVGARPVMPHDHPAKQTNCANGTYFSKGEGIGNARHPERNEGSTIGLSRITKDSAHYKPPTLELCPNCQ